MGTKQRMFLRFILLGIASATPVLAQGDRGEITGTVTDSTGAVVPGGARNCRSDEYQHLIQDGN